MGLTTYQSQLTALLGTTVGGTLYTTANLNTWINEGRQQVALRAQCVRCLSPVAGQITGFTVTSPGSGYLSTPTVTIAGPDFPSGFLPNPNGLQATATAVLSGAQLTALTLLSSGDGYFNPNITFTNGSSVSQGTATAIVANVNATAAGQEQYPFSDVLPIIQSAYSGVANIVGVRSVGLIWGNIRFLEARFSFSKYQAQARIYAGSNSFQYIPSVIAQYQDGVTGTIMMTPAPNTAYQMEWDTVCLPVDLVDDTTFDAIPEPFRSCVQYYAASKAYLSKQRYADSEKMSNDDPNKPGLFQRHLMTARNAASLGGVTYWYGRS